MWRRNIGRKSKIAKCICIMEDEIYATIVIKIFRCICAYVYNNKKFMNIDREIVARVKKKRAIENMEIYEKIREDLLQRIHMETISRIVKQRSLSRWSKLHLWFRWTLRVTRRTLISGDACRDLSRSPKINAFIIKVDRIVNF